MHRLRPRLPNHMEPTEQTWLKRRHVDDVRAHLHDGDDGDEDRWGTQAVLVEVPAPVRLAGQDLVSHVADEALVQTQARLVQQDLPLQRAAAVGDGPAEAAGALAAHLGGNIRLLLLRVRRNLSWATAGRISERGGNLLT